MTEQRRAAGSTLLERYALSGPATEARSLAIVDALLGDRFQGRERAVVRRLLYAAGDATLAPAVRIQPGAVDAGVAALRRGAPILTDVEMVRVAISRTLAGQLGCAVHCAIAEPAVLAAARGSGLPRAAEAMRHLAALLPGAVVAIGNAPTALLALLDLVDAGAPPPALVVGVPVGFVAAAEAKEELLARPLPAISVVGTRGGSALAAAAVNALLQIAAEEATGP